jgi:hypothetical protein
MPGGRPTKYSKSLADYICGEMATGRFLIQVCAEDGMPAYDTVRKWACLNPEFIPMYARARRLQVEARIESAGAKLLETPTCTVPDPDGGVSVRVDAAAVQLMRVRAEHDRWEASKLLKGVKLEAPLDYGDKVQQEHVGPDGGPIVFVARSILDKPE